MKLSHQQQTIYNFTHVLKIVRQMVKGWTAENI